MMGKNIFGPTASGESGFAARDDILGQEKAASAPVHIRNASERSINWADLMKFFSPTNLSNRKMPVCLHKLYRHLAFYC
jgi:hypothetical protein